MKITKQLVGDPCRVFNNSWEVHTFSHASLGQELIIEDDHGGKVSFLGKEIEKCCEELWRVMGKKTEETRIPELEKENEALKQRVKDLMRDFRKCREDYCKKWNRADEIQKEAQQLKEENIKLLKTLLALYRAVKRVNGNLDEIEGECDNDAWFQKLKERTY